MSSGSFDRSHLETLVGLPGLPAPGLLVDCPELGARLCVHNRVRQSAGVGGGRAGGRCIISGGNGRATENMLAGGPEPVLADVLGKGQHKRT